MARGKGQVLERFYVPQVEQFGMAEARRDGDVGTLFSAPREGGGTNWLRVYELGEECLVSAHEIVVESDFVLEEDPPGSLCITSMSASTINSWFDDFPARPGQVSSRRENMLAFMQPDRRTCGMLDGGTSYSSISLCMTPEFFARIGASRAFDAIGCRIEESDGRCVSDLPFELRRLLRAMARGGDEAQLRGQASQALSLLVRHMDEVERARERGRGEGLLLARRAMNVIDANLDRMMGVDELARTLCVGRTRLCAAFKAETGMGVAEWARARRVDRAKELLAETSLSPAEVAHAVGYPRLGSFDDMFRAAVGCSPSAWRNAHFAAR